MNCTTVERRCQYSTPWIAPERSPSDQSASPQIPSTGPTSTPALSSTAFPGLHPSTPVEEAHSTVDMVHMQLLYHYITNVGVYPTMYDCMRNIIMSTALREPYVMHSVLALSAHHLSVTQPDQHAYYHNLAIQLQTQALSLFNRIDVGLFGDSVEKRIPVFIFSCVLGFHALCDTLTHRDPDFDSMLARYVSYLQLHRGMHTVMHGYWDELRKTELGIIFDEMVPQWFKVTAEGQDCDDIKQRLASSGLDEEELKASRAAADLIQWVLDAKPGPKSRAYALCSWVAMLGRPFVHMLEVGRPEALAVLSYYFLAMHYCREVWNFGGAGQHYLTLIADHFRGGDWYAWVEPPYRMLQEALEKEASDGVSPATVNTPSSHPGLNNHSETTC